LTTTTYHDNVLHSCSNHNSVGLFTDNKYSSQVLNPAIRAIAAFRPYPCRVVLQPTMEITFGVRICSILSSRSAVCYINRQQIKLWTNY